MKFKARVKTDNSEWIDMPIRVILLDEQGKPEVVIGSSGLQYSEFKLEQLPYLSDKEVQGE